MQIHLVGLLESKCKIAEAESLEIGSQGTAYVLAPSYPDIANVSSDPARRLARPRRHSNDSAEVGSSAKLDLASDLQTWKGISSKTLGVTKPVCGDKLLRLSAYLIHLG
jgi:hypothetical protein